MIISFIYYVTLSKFVNSSFPQCNVHTGVQGGCLAFPPLDGYLKLYVFMAILDNLISHETCLLSWVSQTSCQIRNENGMDVTSICMPPID